MLVLGKIKDYEIVQEKITYKEYYNSDVELFTNYRKSLQRGGNIKIVNLIIEYENGFINLMLNSFGIDFKDSPAVGMIRLKDGKIRLVNYFRISSSSLLKTSVMYEDSVTWTRR